MPQQFDPTAMDEAAKQAEAQLEEMLVTQDPPPVAEDVIQWFARWYMEAGHKRLGRILVTLSKEMTS